MTSKTKLLLAVLGLAVANASPGNAAIVFFPGEDIAIPTTFAGVSINVETAETSNDLGGAAGADVNFFLGGVGITNDADQTAASPTFQFVRSGANNTDPVANLTVGTVVDGTQVFANDFGGSGGSVAHFLPFISGTPGYVGFSVVLDDTTTAFGWMEVTLQDDNTPGVIHGWAYEDTGAAIEVGAIPEPGHTLLVLLGLACLALRRRRR